MWVAKSDKLADQGGIVPLAASDERRRDFRPPSEESRNLHLTE
jgi:hypothetical protein